jgi:hypothetical protein
MTHSPNHPSEVQPGVFLAGELDPIPEDQQLLAIGDDWYQGTAVLPKDSDRFDRFVISGLRNCIRPLTDRQVWAIKDLLEGHDGGEAKYLADAVNIDIRSVLGWEIDNEEDYPDLTEVLSKIEHQLSGIRGFGPTIPSGLSREEIKVVLFEKINRLSARLDMERRMRILRLGEYIVSRQHGSAELWVAENAWVEGTDMRLAPLTGLAVDDLTPTSQTQLESVKYVSTTRQTITPVVSGTDGEPYLLPRPNKYSHYQIYTHQSNGAAAMQHQHTRQHPDGTRHMRHNDPGEYVSLMYAVSSKRRNEIRNSRKQLKS